MTELRIETVNINSLTPDPANARKHDSKNLKAIASSLEKFGQRKPIVVTPDSIVVAGNGTLEAAKSLGWSEIAIARTPIGWTWDQIKAFALADNRTAELAEWDEFVLSNQLIELDGNGWELEDIGFTNLTPEIIDDPYALLVDEDRKDATQMTFTLTLMQAEVVKASIDKVLKSGQIPEDSENTNRNGNALFLICNEWITNDS